MPADGLECELKWTLLPAEASRLADALSIQAGPPQVQEQENRFFDSSGLVLARSGRSIRLRRQGQQLLLTCKTRMPPSGDIHRCGEWERHLSPVLWPQLEHIDPLLALPLPQWMVHDLIPGELHCLGGFANRRLRWRIDGAEIAIDHSRYAEGGDCELEIEAGNVAVLRPQWLELLAALDIPTRPQPATKLERFLTGLRSLQEPLAGAAVHGYPRS